MAPVRPAHARYLLLLASAALWLLAANSANAQGTVFTYQGKLTVSGNPANGSYDLQFKLFDSAGGPTQIGTTQTVNAVAVSAGIFTVQLDFGAGSFPGTNRYLEIGARAAGVGTFSILSPRQQITATPPTAGSGHYIQNTLNQQAGASLNISGNGIFGGKVTSASLGVGTILPQTTLDVRGWLTLDPGADPLLFTAASGAEHNRYLELFNSPDVMTASGLKAGGVLVSNDYAYANPAKDELIVKGSVAIGQYNTSFEQLVVKGDIFGAIRGESQFDDGVVGQTATGVGVEGIGTSPGSVAIHAVGTSFFSGDTTPLSGFAKGIAVGFNTNATVGYVFAYDYAANLAQSLALNSPGGNVGIGTAAPDRTLTVNGRAKIGVIPLEESLAQVCFNNAGDLLRCGISSLRFKTNVQPFVGGLDIVRRLRPITFNWKKGGQSDIGLGAEDVAKVAPALTFNNSKGEVAGVKYERLDLLLINAIKEQQKEIEQLKEQVRRLRAASHRQRLRR